MYSIIKKGKLLFIFAFVMTSIIFSPSFFPLIENDSYSYIRNESIRLSLYPLLISLFDNNLVNIVILQITILSLSITFLIYSLIIRKVAKSLIFFFTIFLLANIYYTSFAKTILTEALFFSVINFTVSAILLFRYSERKLILSILIGFFLGAIISLRHEGIVISLIFFITFLTLKTSRKNICLLIVSFIIIPFIEISFFYQNNQYRSSVIERSYIGKIFMISGFENFNRHYVSDEYQPYIDKVEPISKEINKFINSISNPFLKNNLVSDYEVVAQYQMEELVDDYIIQKLNKDKISNLFFEIIKGNLLNYFKLTSSHYFALWMPGGKHIFFNQQINENDQKIPFANFLNKSSGSIEVSDNSVLILGLFFFQLIMLVTVFLFFISIYELCVYKFKKNRCINLFSILIQIHLFVISFTNIGTPRYLMPIYSLILVVLIIRLNDFLFKRIGKI